MQNTKPMRKGQLTLEDFLTMKSGTKLIYHMTEKDIKSTHTFVRLYQSQDYQYRDIWLVEVEVESAAIGNYKTHTFAADACLIPGSGGNWNPTNYYSLAETETKKPTLETLSKYDEALAKARRNYSDLVENQNSLIADVENCNDKIMLLQNLFGNDLEA